MDAKHEEFIRDLMKGKIAEILFEQMFRDSGKFTILHSGYEYTIPELAQYQHFVEIKAVIENIRNVPDFILITQDKTQVYLVEVKYRSKIHEKELLGIAERTLQTWEKCWLFVASPSGFFFDPCNRVKNNNGKMNLLDGNWIQNQIQSDYLGLLNQFESRM